MKDEDEKKPEYAALFEVYEAVNSAEKDEEVAPSLWVLPLGSLREIVGEHFALEELSAEVRALVLDLDLPDGEIIVITPGHAGVMGRGSDEC